MNTQSLLDEYFIETRHKLLDLAAFMDRIDRAGGAAGDFRWESLRASLEILRDAGPDRTRRILELMSDPTTAPVATAPGKGAVGAWPEFAGKAG